MQITKTDETDLTMLAQRINETGQLAQDSAKKAIYYAIECGAALIEAKALVKHGEWQDWIKANCEVSDRTAQNYMKLATEYPSLEDAKAQRVADLSIREAIKELSKPKEVKSLDIEIHEICQVFPWLPEDEMVEFVASIKANGLLKPITLFQGKILDGKIRYKACLEAGVEPKFREYEGDDPVGFVTSVNLYRASYTEAIRNQAETQAENLRVMGLHQ